MRLFCLTVFICLGLVPYSHAFARDKLLDIKEVISPGGIKAWLVEDHSVPVIAMEFSFLGAGAINDPDDKQGLAQLASNTLDEGAGDYDSKAFQEALSDNSIQLSFSASRDHFGGSLKTLSRNQSLAYDLLSLALKDPRFDEDSISRMRDANKSRLRSDLSDPEWITARIMNDRIFADHPYARNSGGTLTTLDKITRTDLQNFHQNFLGKDNLVVSVAGDITAAELAAIMDRIFGGLPAVTLPERPAAIDVQNQGTIAVFEKDIPQTIISIAQPGIARNHPDYHTAQVMNYILGSSGFGSRLTKVVREERGLTYGIYSYFMNMDYFSGLQVSTSTENKNVPEMIRLIHQEWDKMKAASVSDAELADTKSYMIGSLPLSLTSTDSIAGLLISLQQDGLPIDYLDQRQNAIAAVTKEDVQRVANALLDTTKMSVVLVGKPEAIENPVVIETLPNAY
jgi:zinc protease